MNFIDFSSINSNFKIIWMRQYLQNSSSIWNIIPRSIFSHLGGLEFLLMCNYKIEKLPIKLSKFYQQVLPGDLFIYTTSPLCNAKPAEGALTRVLTVLHSLYFYTHFLFVAYISMLAVWFCAKYCQFTCLTERYSLIFSA